MKHAGNVATLEEPVESILFYYQGVKRQYDGFTESGWRCHIFLEIWRPWRNGPKIGSVIRLPNHTQISSIVASDPNTGDIYRTNEGVFWDGSMVLNPTVEEITAKANTWLVDAVKDLVFDHEPDEPIG